MNAQELIADFIAKWGPGGAQQHFIELCAVLGVPTPAGGDDYVFEKGMLALGQRRGYADVFKRGHFAWENKAPGKPLEGALRQLMNYAQALDNPPLLIVSDRLRIEVHTRFTGTPSECHIVMLDQLGDPAKRELLRRCFIAPESFKPARTNRQITEEAANAFATTAERLREAGIAAEVTSHLLTQCLFCFFAEDVGLLPGRLFERLVGNPHAEAGALRRGLQALFTTMRDGGLFGADSINWFNGGLFAKVDVPPLTPMDVAALRNAAALDWSAIDPSIFGTLFERGLDPKKRSQLGAHFTDAVTILRVVEPVVQRPLLAEWERVKAVIARHMARHKRAGDAEYRKANDAFVGFLETLRRFRVLDPACGSGNFLYLALKCLKDIEHRANIEAEALGLQRQVDAYTSPANVLGIELNEYAAELARVTVWIGELQWRLQHGYPFKLNPVLDPLDQIECRDALMNADGSEAVWPVVNVVVGNPPFLGSRKLLTELGSAYVQKLRAAYKDRVPHRADLVCHWFERSREEFRNARLAAMGLVATQAIRRGQSVKVLQRLVEETSIFEAWSDEPWVVDGAAVRVSVICVVAKGVEQVDRRLDGQLVGAEIGADLSIGSGMPVVVMKANTGVAFQGVIPLGPFDVPGSLARDWLRQPNPTGASSTQVLFLRANANDLTRRWSDTWLIAFPTALTSIEASAFASPWAYAEAVIKPARRCSKAPDEVKPWDIEQERFWWRHWNPRNELRARLSRLTRYVATPRVSRHRFFVWLSTKVIPDTRLYAICVSDDTSFGCLEARLHRAWALDRASMHGVGNDPTYTAGECFETFPFPANLTPADTAHQRTETLPDGAIIPADLPPAVRPHALTIARAAKRLNDLRERWLNPPEWTRRESEVVPLGMDASPYPDRILPRDGFDKQLSARTLTKLYNERPAWLAQAHEALDAAVAAAYGWPDYTPQMPDEEILRRLLALNRERSTH